MAPPVRISLMYISVWWLQYWVSKMECMDLNSPKGFCRSLPEISLLFSFLDSKHLKTWLPIHQCPFSLHLHGSMPSKQSDILSIHQTQFFAKLHKQIEDCSCLNVFCIYNWKAKRLNCNDNDSSFEVLGAFGNFFGRLCKCILKSEPGCWKSSSSESFDCIFEETNKQNCKSPCEMTNYRMIIRHQTASTPLICLRQ